MHVDVQYKRTLDSTTMVDTNSVHLAELLCQAYQVCSACIGACIRHTHHHTKETLQSFSSEDQQALAAAMPQVAPWDTSHTHHHAMPQDAIINTIMQIQAAPVARYDRTRHRMCATNANASVKRFAPSKTSWPHSSAR